MLEATLMAGIVSFAAIAIVLAGFSGVGMMLATAYFALRRESIVLPGSLTNGAPGH